MAKLGADFYFGIVWLALYCLVAFPYTYKLLALRDKQPLKARGPFLVFLSASMLHLYTIALCAQRITSGSFPCMLTNWGGIVGTVVLFNVYVWRCWTVYFHYQLARHRKLERKAEAQKEQRGGRGSFVSGRAQSVHDRRGAVDKAKQYDDWFLKNRHLVDPSFLIRFFGTISCILILPVGIITATDEKITDPDLQGDECEASSTYLIITFYVILYAVLFGVFSWKLKTVEDNFGITGELKLSAAITLVAVIIWGVFNFPLEKFNEDVFPVSTLALCGAMAGMFYMSTIGPVRQVSDDQTAAQQHAAAAASTGGADVALDDLQSLIHHPDGLSSFSLFLTKEWSVENILFWQEVEAYRAKKAAVLIDPDQMFTLIGEAQVLYAKYIVELSAFQVSVSAASRKEIQANLKTLFQITAQTSVSRLAALESQGAGEVAEMKLGEDAMKTRTIFDHAQLEICQLMEEDSLQRYYQSDEYHDLLNKLAANKINVEVNQEMGLA